MEKGELVAQTKRAICRSIGAFSVFDVCITKLVIDDDLCFFVLGAELVPEIRFCEISWISGWEMSKSAQASLE